MPRVLWITGRLPFPLHSGDALYTAGLLQAALHAGCDVTTIGLPRSPAPDCAKPPVATGVNWHPVISEPRSPLGSLLSSLPKDAYSLYPDGFDRALTALLQQRWDWIVFDHARSGAALPHAVAHTAKHSGSKIAYVAHNVERTVRRDVAAGMSTRVLRPVYWIDAEKYGRLEDSLVRASAAVMTISEEDAAVFRGNGAVAYHVPPVFMGQRVPARTLDQSVPRRAMLLGSFDWVAKQNNLVQFLERVAARLVAAGIGVDIVGSMPKDLQSKLRASFPAVDFHGSVADIGPIAARARCGVIPEELGGGMKMKTLDYVFLRVPVFSLVSGAAGLPLEARGQAFAARTLGELGDSILATIDNLGELDARQKQAFDACERRFSVRATMDRGVRKI